MELSIGIQQWPQTFSCTSIGALWRFWGSPVAVNSVENEHIVYKAIQVPFLQIAAMVSPDSKMSQGHTWGPPESQILFYRQLTRSSHTVWLRVWVHPFERRYTRQIKQSGKQSQPSLQPGNTAVSLAKNYSIMFPPDSAKPLLQNKAIQPPEMF